jgi:dihydrofolate reductase
MRKIIVIAFLTIDGVMQAPGGPEEDTSGGFEYGGWIVPYSDEFSGKVIAQRMKPPFALLLGRKTYEIFAAYWPTHENAWPGVNAATKYVVSHKLASHEWAHSVFINDNVVDELRKLKEHDGPPLHVYGSSKLTQTLLKNDLVDELWLMIFPITLGTGKRLFGDGTIPVAYKLTDSKVSPSGVIFATYERAGEVKTGSFAE